MRCYSYDCLNNEDGYCCIDDYVIITEEHECDSYSYNPYCCKEIDEEVTNE